MKIAISTDGQYVSPHFGRCPQFTILEIKDNKLVGKEIIDNPGHHPGYLPQYLNKIGVNYIRAGSLFIFSFFKFFYCILYTASSS